MESSPDSQLGGLLLCAPDDLALTGTTELPPVGMEKKRENGKTMRGLVNVDLTLALSSSLLPITGDQCHTLPLPPRRSGFRHPFLSFVSGVRRRHRRAATSFDRKVASSLLFLDFSDDSSLSLSTTKLGSHFLLPPFPFRLTQQAGGAAIVACDLYSRVICSHLQVSNIFQLSK
ncbi:hypothetical protein JCGZ_26546 [Jatropha curcas]|uniref:Uncharacterized protein n=1 Tax=Jatropha curcas TaxID=180498 RepID=A0A067JKK2_JATCU|nr:hypothetical protein JCGZ_26546 [Jatropha curcas]